MVSKEKVEDSMHIILHAGDARVHCTNALKSLEADDVHAAEEEMALANTEIVKAHKIQTRSISLETQGNASEYSLLFAHAQDTLMTIYSELNITKRLIKIFKQQQARFTKIEERLNKLEGKSNHVN